MEKFPPRGGVGQENDIGGLRRRLRRSDLRILDVGRLGVATFVHQSHREGNEVGFEVSWRNGA